MANCPSGGVVLAGSHSASSALHAVLAETEAAFPSALLDAGLPENHEVFRRTYPEVLPRYEAARLASTRRADIARYLAGALRKVVVWRGSAGDLPLHDALEVTASRSPCRCMRLPVRRAGGRAWSIGGRNGNRNDGHRSPRCWLSAVSRHQLRARRSPG